MKIVLSLVYNASTNQRPPCGELRFGSPQKTKMEDTDGKFVFAGTEKNKYLNCSYVTINLKLSMYFYVKYCI